MLTRIDLPVVGAGPDRFVLRRTPVNQPRYVRVWYHGGGQGPGGSSRQEDRINEEDGCVDYFGEGTPHSAPDGNLTTGWIRPDGPAPGGGLTTESDVIYTNALLDRVREDHPGLPIYIAGYSSGGAFFTSCMHNGSLDLNGVGGWAVVKNTPVFDWLTSEPSISDRELVSLSPLPDKMVFWYATGDTEASQDHAEGHTTFVEAAEVFDNTYDDPVSREVGYLCGRRGKVRLTTRQSWGYMSVREEGGSHSSAWGCVGRGIHMFFIGALF